MQPELTDTISSALLYSRVVFSKGSRHWQDTENRRNGRTDIEVFMPSPKKNMETDVTVICTETKNMIEHTACLGGEECKHRIKNCGSDMRPLEYAEKRKNLAHKDAVEITGKQFFPFAMTVYGSFDAKCHKFVNALAGIASKRFPTKWVNSGKWSLHFKTSLVFQLHRGNSHMWQKALILFGE